MTLSGYPCLNWSDDRIISDTSWSMAYLAYSKMHSASFNNKYPAESHNYCRNIVYPITDADAALWCFSSRMYPVTKYCDIPQCIGIYDKNYIKGFYYPVTFNQNGIQFLLSLGFPQFR